MAELSTASEWKIAEENAGEKVENQGSRLEVYSCKKKKSILKFSWFPSPADLN